MCTVIVGYGLSERQPVVIAANRDEMLDRVAGPPHLWDGDPVMLAPVDCVRHGTWIGVNAHGVFAALTNRIDVKSVPHDDVSRPKQESRGDIVILALQASTAEDAVGRIARLSSRRYNGFHVVIGDATNGLWTLTSGGVDDRNEHPVVFDRISPGSRALVIVSNLGIGPEHSPRAEAICREWERGRLGRIGEKPHRATWNRLLTIHDPDPKLDPEWMRRMTSTCIHRPADEGYGTRSSAYIELSARFGPYPAEWRYWHRERRGHAHACQSRWDAVRTLPVIA